MRIGALISLLGQHPADLEIVADIGRGQSIDATAIELRDLIDRGTGKLDCTVLQIRHSSYDQEIGHRHLSDEERGKMRYEILDGLMDMNRPGKCAPRRYTSIHGDCRIYHHFGGDNDTCYGTAYDPRLFAEPEAEGLIRPYPVAYSRPHYEITTAGEATLAKLSGAKRAD